MTVIGFHCFHEQINPAHLLRDVRHAEQAGFTAAMSSDHFSPWSARQGESGFAWPFLGAALATTDLSFGVVNAPGQRYHPAVVAQAIVSGADVSTPLLAALRIGEASNERVTGDAWPRKEVRDQRLVDCVDVIRRLLCGEEVSHDGLVRVNRARLWTLPESVPDLVGAAVTPETAARHAAWADGLVTVNQPKETLRRVLDSYREAGGRGLVRLQIHLSWAPTEDEAVAIAHDQWRSNVFAPLVCWDLETVDALTRSGDRSPGGEGDRKSPSRRPRKARRVACAGHRAGLGRVVSALREQGPVGLHRHVRGARATPAVADPTTAERGDRMRKIDTGDLWWKNAVFYCADIETFYDWNGDGCGDIRGMAERIEYLFDLGVTCLWLMPFYPTARKDDGYDITDFFGVDSRLGTLGDFVELVRTARSCGIRVIVDFVMNHTSDAHPWFKSARRSKDDPYRDYYVWSATEPKSSRKDVVFPDQEDSLWELEPRTNEWYLHHFYKHQPDLNIANPKVQEEISRTLGFWLELGVSGFRVDAVPFLFAKAGAPGDPGVFDPNEFLGDVRNFITRRTGDAVLLGEVNLTYKDQKTFFGGPDGDGLNMQFDFIGMQNFYLSLARGDARPIAKALRQRPALDVTSQWANFVRNHDELTLDKLSEDERQEVFDAFGPDPDMQLYGRGLRRRLPSMLGGDERRMRMAYSLAFSLARHPCSVLRRGDRDGRKPRRAWAARGAHAHAVDQWRQRRLLHVFEAAAHSSDSGRPLRAGARERRRPASRSPVLLVVHSRPDLHVSATA